MTNKRRLLMIIGLALLVLGVGSFIRQALSPPWSSYDGTVCVFSDCYFSEGNQKNKYWIDQAIKKKDVSLCDNVGENDEGDYKNSIESYQEYCRRVVPRE